MKVLLTTTPDPVARDEQMSATDRPPNVRLATPGCVVQPSSDCKIKASHSDDASQCGICSISFVAYRRAGFE
jgi:hypothetical protein